MEHTIRTNIFHEIVPDVFCFEDTCNIYVLRSGRTATLVEYGSGEVMERLTEIGVEQVTDVLLTHHHRDCAQGLEQAAAAGAQIWVPHAEQDLFRTVEDHWQSREVFNNYNPRQDRFSRLENIHVNGTLRDYERRKFSGWDLLVLPTPGHTLGSISLLAEKDGQRLAFSGDLIYEPGKVWSMAATQWTYNGAEGAAASVLSLILLKDHRPDLLLPSHGAPMEDPSSAIDLLVERLLGLIQLRKWKNLRLVELRERPYEPITPHLLRCRACLANSYVLLSDSGKALMIDFGYDFNTDLPWGSDRASRRPWLYNLPRLKRDYNVTKVDVVIPTHYHDDHVAGIELLQRVEGTQSWMAENFADILERPERYDLPCLWYDPIPVDRRLPLGKPIQWEEYTLRLYALPGHTRYAVAVVFKVDGQRVMAAGDQYQEQDGLRFNYVYTGGFTPEDYCLSAAVYREVNPTLILPGHFLPIWVKPDYVDTLSEQAVMLARLHHQLLPEDGGGDGFSTHLHPYQVKVLQGSPVDLEIEVENPLSKSVNVSARPVLPKGWLADREEIFLQIPPQNAGRIPFQVFPPPGFYGRRARVAVDLVIGERQLGQRAEALITVMENN